MGSHWKQKEKRYKISPHKRITKQPKINDYWLSSPTHTANRFDPEPENKMSHTKASPIFVKGVKNIFPSTILLYNKLQKIMKRSLTMNK